MTYTTIRITQADNERIEALAEEGESKAGVVARLLDAYEPPAELTEERVRELAREEIRTFADG